MKVFSRDILQKGFGRWVVWISGITLLLALYGLRVRDSGQWDWILGLALIATMALSSWSFYFTIGGDDRASAVGKFNLRGIRANPMWMIRVGSLLILLAAGTIWTMLLFQLDGFYTTPDTIQYARVAAQPLGSTAFWFGERPISLPLIFKLFGFHPGDLPLRPDTTSAIRVTQFQAFFSLGSFVMLGLVLAAQVRSLWLKAASLFLIPLFGMTIDVGMWNRILLSESLSLSFFALAAALTFLSLDLWEGWQERSTTYKSALLLLTLLAVTFFVGLRDVHAYLLLMLVPVMLIGFAFRSIRTHPGFPIYMVALVVIVLLVGFQLVSMNRGERWLAPYVNLLTARILPKPEARNFFAERGAPIETVFREAGDYGRRQLYGYLFEDQDGRALLAWIREQGTRTYLAYLLRRVDQTLITPLQNMRHLLDAGSSEYRNQQHPDPLWMSAVSRFLFPRGWKMLLVWGMGLVGLMAVLTFIGDGRSSWLLPAFMILSAIPLSYLIWHGDAIEAERHATQVAFQYRLGLWSGSLLMAGKAWELRGGGVERDRR